MVKPALTTAPNAARILIISALENETRRLAAALASDYQISAAANVQDAASRMQKEIFNAIIYDLGRQGAALGHAIQTLQNIAPSSPVIVTGQIDDAALIVKAIKAGAFDFLTKPFAAEKLKLSVHQALETRSLKNEIDYLRRQQDVIYDYDRIIAVSPAMQEVIVALKKLARTDSTLLITGETGTGKSFFSGNIHFNSSRANKPFIKVNCANIPETLLESELFGHEKGSFTGADKTRTGRFEQADGGTLFLDEFCELNLFLQAKLLRALEEKVFERLGGNKTIRADTRIIAATNRNIEELVEAGEFREDLYYRINVLRIHLPPLRDRRECIEPLSYFLLHRLCRAVKKRVEAFSPEVMRMFQGYSWPGNIRQLANTIERAVLMEDSPVIQESAISLPQTKRKASRESASPGLKLSAEQQKHLICTALENNLWVQKDAARQLGITPRALNYRIKKLGITHAHWRKNK
ncbi:MAG: sigma-54-dependent Fis family transcriptional regulator [Desulfobacterales bacterium]|nr:MAG: sigma-54-dependent Fis family transcriptional regulator [Desulfobacterales bacterium]